ncbi:hypothetical protein S245_065845 [Arachis hypogaea]
MVDQQILPKKKKTVQNILEQKTLKWVFVGDKGGMDKATCNSILSILFDIVDGSVLIISTDPTHNLSDVFQQRFTKTSILVNDFTNLYAMEVDPTIEHKDIGILQSVSSELRVYRRRRCRSHHS